MQKTVWLVTHAETVLQNCWGEWLPDPEMDQEGGFQVVAALRSVLEEKLERELPSGIHCGTGRRQWQVACALGFNNPELVCFSSLWGDASTLAVYDRKRMVLLGHGLLIPYDRYYSAKHVGGDTIKKVLASLPPKSVICSGRPVLVRLGMKPEECHSGALYALNVQDTGEIAIELVQQGKILAS